MSVFTLSKAPEETKLLADGVPVLLAANSTGVTILEDIYAYILNPTSITRGISLLYVEKHQAWVTPDWNLCLFNLTSDSILLGEIKSIINAYGQSKVFLKNYGQIWGYLSTDAGVPLELQPQELLMLEPQDKRKCVEDFYLTSKNYQVLSIEGFEAKQFGLLDSIQHVILNSTEDFEELDTTQFLLDEAILNASVYLYTNEIEKLSFNDFSFLEAKISEVVLPPIIVEPESFSFDPLSLSEATLSLVVLPTNNMEVEGITLQDNFSVDYAQYGDP